MSAGSISTERQNGDMANTRNGDMSGERIPPVNITDLRVTGRELRERGIAGILVDMSSRSGNLIPSFFDSREILTARSVEHGKLTAIQFSLQDPEGILTQVTVAPRRATIEFILKSHLPQ